MTLTEFLTARLDEDEAVAQQAYSPAYPRPTLWNGPGQTPAMSKTRVLAEVEAKRRIVDWWMAGRDGNESGSDTRRLLGLLALPYADHPDYDEAWRV